MARFDKVIGTLLNDIIRAQHEANQYAEQLHNEYQKKGSVKQINLPQAVIGSVELNLNYAVEDALCEYEKFELDYNKLYSFLKDFAYQSAKVVVSIIVSELKPSVTEENCKGLGLWSVLSEEKGIEYRKLLTYTSRKIYSELVTLNETILDEQGSIQVEPLVKAISFIVDSDLLMQPDIELMFTKKGDEERSKIKQTISDTLPPFVEQAVTDFNFVNKRLLTTANVIVDAKGLEKIPSECMHSIRLKVNIPNIPENIDYDKY